VVCALAGPARAAERGALQVEQFEPLPAGSGILNVATSDVLPHRAWAADAWVSYARSPFGLKPVAEDDVRDKGAVLKHRLRSELVLGYGLLDALELAVGVPMALDLGGATYGVAGRGSGELEGAELGDVRVLAHLDLKAFRAFRERLPAGLGLGLGLSAWVPSGDVRTFNGEGEPRYEPRLLADWGSDGGLRVAANLAYHIRTPSRVFSFVNDDVLRWSLAASTPIGLHAVEVVGGVFGALHLSEQPHPADLTKSLDERLYDPIEALLGFRLGLPAGAELTLAAGRGLTRGIGAPSLRLMMQLGLGRPGHRGRLPSYLAVRDSDDDDLPDLVDQCPREPELLDGQDDEDGCPEAPPAVVALVAEETAEPEERGGGRPPPPRRTRAEWPKLPPLPPVVASGDGDGDGVSDREDLCPEDAEDLDGFEDLDGCAEPDDDQDGRVDAEDRCRQEAETFNGFDDEDGCPEIGPDADEDRVDDFYDLCPLERERTDGIRDWDGCPETDPETLRRELEVWFPPPPSFARQDKKQEKLELDDLPPLARLTDRDGDGLESGLDVCPDQPEDGDGFEDGDGCPDPDDDLDGVLDGQDRCRFVAETINDFEDEDGCPDVGPDTDADTVGDYYDLCPLEPENLDATRDWDGCPEADLDDLLAKLAVWEPTPSTQDTAGESPGLPPLEQLGDLDGDGLKGVDDQCPEEPEDLDGLADGDGCPDLDVDGDSFADGADKCPVEAETLNGFEDDDGCPDLVPIALSEVSGVVESIQFDKGKATLRRSSKPTLDKVALALTQLLDLRLHIRGHTDSLGSAADNLLLSQQRADTVRDWLIEHGVPPERLRAEGLGETEPLVEETGKGTRARNRRVELEYVTVEEGEEGSP